MPLEIRELIIRATVGNSNAEGTGSDGSGGSANESQIDKIVDKVFEIIKEKSER